MSKPEGNNDRGNRAECKNVRLVLVVGSRTDRSLDAALQFVLDRAATLGGNFRVWHSLSAGSPPQRLIDVDVSGGKVDDNPTEYAADGFGDLLADCQNCQGRIVELLIFHHGDPVNEALLAKRLLRLFQEIRVPICRVVWWACDAEVSLDVSLGGWTDSFMKTLGSIARCRPCGCDSPIELIWPTAGRCYLVPAGESFEPRTNDGELNRARWGYPQPGGGIGPRPDPSDPQPTHNPPDRDPPHDQEPTEGPGQVLGVDVTKHDG